MRLLKLFLISVTVFLILLFGMSIILPSSVVISRAVDISANSKDAFNKINNCIVWKTWITQLNDSSLKNISATKIHSGKFEVTITSVEADRVISQWVDSKGNIQESTMRVISSPSVPNATTVQWQYEEHISWYQPWEKFASLVGDQILGTMMETNLNNLKKLLETN